MGFRYHPQGKELKREHDNMTGEIQAFPRFASFAQFGQVRIV
jgi:hypothetical protein